MTQMFASNSKNDLYLDSHGNIAIITGLQATIQACEHIAKTQLGEMFLSVNRGIPNFQTVWVGVPNIAQFEAALRGALLKVNGVTEIRSLNTVIQNNTLSYTATILTIYGEGTVNG